MGNVTTLKTVDSSVISFIILLFILFNSYRRIDKMFKAHNLFISLVIINIFMLVVDYLAWAFNGYTGGINPALNAGFNCLLYACVPAAPMVWLLYVNYQVLNDDKRLDKIKPLLWAVFAANALISVISLFTGWYFYIDAQNVYHRGPLFIVHVLICYALLTYTIIFVLRHRRTIEKRYFLSMLLFFVPPAAGTLLQVFIYGVSYNWVGMALAVLVIYFNIQNRGLNTDYLTGAYNKRRLDAYTRAKAKSGGEDGSFSAITFDLDNLKEINDTLGHDTGDEALKDTVAVVRGSIRENDFISRIGGDEFVVILDIHSKKELESAKKRIEDNFAVFNAEGLRPYTLSLSYGSGVFDMRSGKSLDEFFKGIDALMYEEKNKKKEKREE